MEASENCVKLTRYFFPLVERSDADLRTQLGQAERIVTVSVTTPLLPHQFDALVCLVSDIIGGLVAPPSGTFSTSFLLTAVNKQMFQIAAAEFCMFCYSDGGINRRAWEKRKAEQYLFTRGSLLFD